MERRKHRKARILRGHWRKKGRVPAEKWYVGRYELVRDSTSLDKPPSLFVKKEVLSEIRKREGGRLLLVSLLVEVGGGGGKRKNKRHGGLSSKKSQNSQRKKKEKTKKHFAPEKSPPRREPLSAAKGVQEKGRHLERSRPVILKPEAL